MKRLIRRQRVSADQLRVVGVLSEALKLPNKDDPDLLLKLQAHFAHHEATFDNLNRILAEHEKRQDRNARRRQRRRRKS